MILIKSPAEIELMRMAGRAASAALFTAGRAVAPGVTTRELDAIVVRVLKEFGCTASSLGYNGFPASSCISLNDVVIHGIPGGRVIREGDVVKLDIVAGYNGFHGDCAAAFFAGQVSDTAQKLAGAAERAFYAGLEKAVEGNRISDISAAIQESAEAEGFSVVRRFIGHGIGRSMHEDPEVPLFGKPGRGPRLERGMTITIEPMVNEGTYDVYVDSKDGWTVYTADHKLSAHFENTVLITGGQPEILTKFDG